MKALILMLKAAADEALSTRSLLTLALLYDRGEQNMSALALACGCTPAGMTVLIDRLDEAHLVSRDARISLDRRTVMVKLTTAGVAMVEALVARMALETNLHAS